MSVKDRVGRIGSSDVAPILGVDRFRTAYDVWEVVTGKKEPFEGDEMTELGNALESAVLERFSWQLRDEDGYEVSPVEEVAHPEYPWFVVHPDQILTSSHADSLVVEAKTGGIQREGDWANGVPEYYVPQGVAHMACTGARTCYFPTFLGSLSIRKLLAELLTDGVSQSKIAARLDPFLAPELEWRDDFELVIEAVVEFYEECIVKDVPPAAQNLDDCRKRWRRSVQRVVEATPELRDDVVRLDEARREATALKAEIERLTFTVLNALGDAEGLVWHGDLIATCKTNRAFDPGWVKEHHPDLWEQFQTVAEPKFDAAAFKKAHRKLAEQAMAPGAGARPLKTRIKTEE